MNDPGLFILGAIVALIVSGAIAVLVYGALLDGRTVREQRRIDEELERRGEERETAAPASR